MGINRTIWCSTFSHSSMPMWTCPTCGHGALTLRDVCHNKDTQPAVVFAPDAMSMRYRKHENWHPMDDGGVFSAILTCATCSENLAVSGTWTNDVGYDECGSESYHPTFAPLFVNPPLHVFQIPESCPKALKEAVISAFSIMWCDQNACVNQIRSAIELVLTHVGIPRFQVKGKRRFLSLAKRVDRLPTRYSNLKNELTALRWLGNAGSHTGQITKNDALDGFELLEHVFEELFNPRSKRIGKISKGINKRKGPRRIV